MSLGEGDAESSPQVLAGRKLCLALQSEEKRVRKQALVDFQKFLSDTNLTPEEHHAAFKQCHIYLLNTLRDKSEPVREQGIKFMNFFIIDTLPNNDFYIAYLFPLLIERIGTVELVEESEEIRLQLVQFLQAIVDKYSADCQLKPFLNDIVLILKEMVKDKYPEIKVASCKCIVSVATALPRDFHMQAECLVEPVLTAFGHQRYKIRIEAIKCIGELILHCKYEALDKAVGPLAERLFDSIPVVRRTVAQVAARWLLDYRDRYSFWHKLLPLILTGLNDEVPETQEESQRLWLNVGLQYMSENEKDLKDQMDYLTQPPKYYPENLIRANLGCRTLVQISIGKIVGALARELVSWQADVRVRCSQLLCSVAHHGEAGLTQHLQGLLMGMYTAARDEDERVVANVIRACEIMGVFVPPDTWTQLIIPVIEDTPHYGHLVVLAAFIRGSPQEYVSSFLREISQVLADPDICQSRKMKYQRELINCSKAIQSKYTGELSEDIGEYLFNITVTTLSVKDHDNTHLDFTLLDDLTKTLNFESNYNLWSKFVGNLLDYLVKKDPKCWTEITIERCMFEVILLNSGEAFGENLIQIGEILSEALDIEAEAESRLKTFMGLSNALETKDIIFKNAGEKLQTFLEKLVTDVLVPSLIWHAGRTAEAMRTMAASCLCSALSPSNNVDLFGTKEVLRPIFDRLLPLLLSLVEDASYKSRHLALEDLVLLKENLVLKNCWENDDLIKIYPEILKRLDDPNDRVRICAIKSLKVMLESPPDEFKSLTYKAHHELLLDTLLTHFDDEDAGFQELVYDVLKTMVNVSKEMVEDKVEKSKPLVRNQEGCSNILTYSRCLNN